MINPTPVTIREHEREREKESKLAFPKIGIVFVSFFLAFNLGYPQIASATIFQPGETLTPDCAPGSANCGVATTTPIGILYGGTGLTSAPNYGQLLVGNSSGGYTLTATSSLGLLFSTAGDWTGTFDGQEGSYYLNALNLNNFGAPFYTFFSATTTSALAEGSNLYFTNNRVASVIAGTTTTALAEGSNLYFTNNRVAGVIAGTTTDALAQGSTNKYYSNTLVNSYIHASTTIPKTYTANIFTGLQTLNGGLTINSLNGPLQANAGVVSATTSVGVIYGGTGLSSMPSFGQILRGTGSGYTLAATSTLGVDLSDTTGTLIVSRGGTGATSFNQGWLFSSGDGNALSASTSPTVNYIIATSTTATSTFANGINLSNKGCFAIMGVCILSNATSTNYWYANGNNIYNANSSNVGIGTTSPYSMFSVAGQIVGQNFVATTTTATSTFAGGMSVAGTAGLTVLQNGKVGVGTAAPTAGLDIRNNLQVVDETDTNNLRGILNYENSNDAAAGQMGFFKSRGASFTSPTTVVNGDYIGGFSFNAYSGSAYLNTAGFGARVNGTVTTASVPQDLFFTTSGGSDDTNPYVNNHVRMLISSTGNIGIGTTTPDQKLTISGGAGTNRLISFSSTNTTLGYLGLGTDNLYRLASNGANSLTFNTNSADRMTISATGKIGINEANPVSALHISTSTLLANGVGVSEMITLQSIGAGDGQIARIVWSPYSGTKLASVDFIGNSLSNFTSQLAFRTSNNATTGERMRIDGLGNVGIGTTTPGTVVPNGWTGSGNKMLEIAGGTNANAGIELTRNDTNIAGIDIWHDGINGDAYFDNRWNNDQGDIFFRTKTQGTPINALTIKGSGNVGIGTTSPYAALSVAGASGVVANVFTATSATATSTFANGINITGGCFSKNGVCIGTGSTGSDLQYVTSYKPNDTFTNITSATTTLTTVSITPATATGDVVVQAGVSFTSSNGTDQPVSLAIRQTNCNGTILQSTFYTIAAAAGAEQYRLDLSYVAVDPGSSSQTYAFCISTSAGDTDVSAWNMSAIVIDTGADLAEIYTTNDASLQAGDVVSYDFALKTGVKKSANAYDQNVLGIVSTRPGMVVGGVSKEGVQALPVALSGRVPVKVITENGSIEPGDYLTPSSVPGVAMKNNGLGPVIGQAMSAYSGEGVGMVVAFVKNFELGAIGQEAILLGDISPQTGATSTDNGLSTLVSTIQAEAAHNPIAIISQKIKDGKQFLADFITARVTSIRGYFDEIFAKKVQTDEIFAKKICLQNSDGIDVCVNGDQLTSLLRNANISPAANPIPQTLPQITTDTISNGETATTTADNPEPISGSASPAAIEPVSQPSPEVSTSTPATTDATADTTVETPQPLPEVSAGTATETPTPPEPAPAASEPAS